jgi:hypothetical protein
MKEDLEKASKERDIRPWLVVGTHHALYCSYKWHPEYSEVVDYGFDFEPCTVEPLTTRPVFEDLFNQYSVDFYFNGHIHNYERDTAIYHGNEAPCEAESENYIKNPEAPIYITIGSAGNREGHAWINPDPPAFERKQS